MTVHPSLGQVADSLELPAATVEAARSSVSESSAPFAVATLERTDEELALNPRLTLETTLSELPGISVNNRAHLALGERLSIRGMGARAAFGVRGVQVLLDGVPLTMPDGQAITDIVDPALIRRAELIRGPSSLYWGNGSGGALFLKTIPSFSDDALVRIQALGGSYGTNRFGAETAIHTGRNHLFAFASTFGQEGYRDYSSGRISRAGASGRLGLSNHTSLDITGAAAFLDTEHPGSLTHEEVETNREAANPGYVATQSGKRSTQLQLGSTLRHSISDGVVTITAWGLLRDLDNPLPFAYIDLNRLAGGLRLALQRESGSLQWGVGADGAVLHDDRVNRNNDSGAPGSELVLDQIETVTSGAMFGYATLRLSPRLSATAGLRGDLVHFSMEDRLAIDGDQSGDRDFLSWTPSLGLAYQLEHTVLFANFGTSFETPTTTELVNSPDGSPGFNPNLEPQRTRGLEAGVRGSAPSVGLSLDAAFFYLRVLDRLVPFQTEDGGGRTFYRNGGENGHTGVELATKWSSGSFFSARLSYTYSHLRYLDDELSGNRVPGVPPHRLYVAATVSGSGFYSEFVMRTSSEYYVDDANTVHNSGYIVFDVSAGYEDLTVGSVLLQPFIQILNLADQSYAGSVQVNAFGGRYYEPSPGRWVRVGLTVGI